MPMSEVHTGLLSGSRATAGGASSWIARWSLADWVATFLIAAAGLKFDKMPPFERALKPQLHDPTISYPHTPPHLQQVPAGLLWRLSLPLPLLLVLPLALVRPPRGVPAARLLCELWLGVTSSVACALFLVCFVKAAVGRLRPDFLARCNPDANLVCTGAASLVEEGRRSFPSGHSALSFAGLGFAALALYARFAPVATPRLGKLWKLVLALLPWLLALSVALSRLQDYWHHWQDVLVGSLIGHACAGVAFGLRFPAPWRRAADGACGLVPRVVLAEEEERATAVSLKERPSPPEGV